MISHRYKCIFIHIPKCAGTSIERALGHHDLYEGWGAQDHRTIAEIEPFSASWSLSGRSLQATASNLERRLSLTPPRNPCNGYVVTRSEYLDYFRFSIVRNPWTRVHSWYRNVMNDERHRARLKTEQTSFGTFVKRFAGEGLIRPQVEWLKSRSGRIELNFIGRFESLEDDFDVVCNRLSITGLELPHLMSSGEVQPVASELDDETDAIIRRTYAEDIAQFGYSRPW